jgi:hypothetical protein
MSAKQNWIGGAVVLAALFCASPDGQAYLKRITTARQTPTPLALPPDPVLAIIDKAKAEADQRVYGGSAPEIAAPLPAMEIPEMTRRAGTVPRATAMPDYRATLDGSLASAMQPVGAGPASREHAPALGYMPPLTTPAPPSRPLFDAPVVVNRAGPGIYSAGNGDIYAQAGPGGVVNTRTGEFSPIN